LSAADQAAMISRITVAFAVTQLAFEAAALLLEIDTHESWSKLSEKPRGAHDANRFRSKP
jgi:hypothetical protein